MSHRLGIAFGRRTHGTWVAAPGIALLLALAAPLHAAGEDTKETTRARMGQIFESMQILLPLSVDEAAFAAPENREKVRKALETVAENADAVSRHARQDDVGRRFLGRSLHDDASRALARYDEGRTGNAAFLVRQATENCIACHTKLASPGDSPRAASFVSETELARLPAGERARLLIATRQFDAAETALEQLVTDPATPPSQLLPALTDYLVVAMRVKGDYARPIPTLEKVAARPDLWSRLQEDVQQWIRSLRELEKGGQPKPDLAAARQRIDKARALVPYPADDAGLVEYVYASGILHGFLETDPASPKDAAEAWYLLGVTESETARGFWVSEAELYLETAIRTDPKAPSAKKAYDLLEEGIVLDYSGSAGVNVPHAERERLAELRGLIDAK